MTLTAVVGEGQQLQGEAVRSQGWCPSLCIVQEVRASMVNLRLML